MPFALRLSMLLLTLFALALSRPADAGESGGPRVLFVDQFPSPRNAWAERFIGLMREAAEELDIDFRVFPGRTGPASPSPGCGPFSRDPSDRTISSSAPDRTRARSSFRSPKTRRFLFSSSTPGCRSASRPASAVRARRSKDG